VSEKLICTLDVNVRCPGCGLIMSWEEGMEIISCLVKGCKHYMKRFKRPTVVVELEGVKE